MKDKINYFEVNGIKYPLCCNLNVLEAIQEKYGSMTAWGEIVENKAGKEPKIKDLKYGFMIMINEALDIENEKLEEKRQLLTEKQVGRLLTELGIAEATKKIEELSISSNSTGEEPKNM